jgi:hydrogenase maturation protease
MRSTETENFRENAPETDRPVLVIGYGNVLRGDDGAGPAAAEKLRDCLPGKTAEVLAVHQLLPELVEPLRRSQLAIFIDADWNIPPGHVEKRSLDIRSDGASAIGHHQSPENLLKMAQELYGHAPRALLFHVGASEFGYHQGLSRPVRVAVAQLVREVVATIKSSLPSLTKAHGAGSEIPPAHLRHKH